MVLSKMGYGVLCFILIFSLCALTASESFGGPAPQDKEYRSVTFYVA